MNECEEKLAHKLRLMNFNDAFVVDLFGEKPIIIGFDHDCTIILVPLCTQLSYFNQIWLLQNQN